MSENDQLKKKLKATSDRLEKMTSDLKNSEEEKKKMSDRLQQVETHRDLLLDKVRPQNLQITRQICWKVIPQNMYTYISH